MTTESPGPCSRNIPRQAGGDTLGPNRPSPSRGVHRPPAPAGEVEFDVLSPLDDYPVHQISEPMRHVGTSDRNFYDRYYFNIHGTGEVHGTDDELFAVIGVGQYPNLSVADAFVS